MKQQYQEEYFKALEPQKDGKFWKVFWTSLAVAFALVGVAASFSSCHTVKRACKTLDAHPKSAAEYCAARFPVKEKTRTIIKHTPGKPVKVPGDPIYVTVDCDSVVRAAQRGSQIVTPSKIVRIPVPTYLQVDTASIQEVIERENVAALAAKDLRFDSLSKACVVLAADRTKALQTALKSTNSAIWGWLAFILLAIIDAVFLWLMKKGVIR